MQPLRLPARTRGSSLIETLIATSLGLLVLVLSTNSVLAVVVGENRTGAAKALSTSLEFARAEAAQRGIPVALCGLDPRDASPSASAVHCAPPGSAWQSGWIVFADTNLNGDLDDGEAVLQVTRGATQLITPESDAASAPVEFRPIGTLAHATPRRLLIGADSTQNTPAQAVCVAIDGFTRVVSASAPCL